MSYLEENSNQIDFYVPAVLRYKHSLEKLQKYNQCTLQHSPLFESYINVCSAHLRAQLEVIILSVFVPNPPVDSCNFI